MLKHPVPLPLLVGFLDLQPPVEREYSVSFSSLVCCRAEQEDWPGRAVERWLDLEVRRNESRRGLLWNGACCACKVGDASGLVWQLLCLTDSGGGGGEELMARIAASRCRRGQTS